jgi:hypothetical protein
LLINPFFSSVLQVRTNQTATLLISLFVSFLVQKLYFL